MTITGEITKYNAQIFDTKTKEILYKETSFKSEQAALKWILKKTDNYVGEFTYTISPVKQKRRRKKK